MYSSTQDEDVDRKVFARLESDTNTITKTATLTVSGFCTPRIQFPLQDDTGGERRDKLQCDATHGRFTYAEFQREITALNSEFDRMNATTRRFFFITLPVFVVVLVALVFLGSVSIRALSIAVVVLFALLLPGSYFTFTMFKRKYFIPHLPLVFERLDMCICELNTRYHGRGIAWIGIAMGDSYTISIELNETRPDSHRQALADVPLAQIVPSRV